MGNAESFEPSFTGGVGVGYVWGPYFRTDLTVDVHSIMNTEQKGSGVIDVLVSPVFVTAQDKTKFMSTILLANAYYDFRTGTPWTPYLGAGVGFAVNQLTRNFSLTVDDGQAAHPAIGPPTCSSPLRPWPACPMIYLTFVAIDVNYRFLHIGGSEVSLEPTSIRPSKSAASTSTRSAPAYGST